MNGSPEASTHTGWCRYASTSLAAKGVGHTELQEAEWGVVTSIRLPGGASLGLYEPRHALAVKTAVSS